MSTSPRLAHREDLLTFRARLKAYQGLWGGEETPISWGTFCAALDVYDEARREAETKKERLAFEDAR